MRNLECTEFLRLCLPRLRLRWAGFRKVRRQVCKELSRRKAELGLPGFSAYEEYIKDHPEEWKILDSACRITISRFYRDKGVFEELCFKLLPSLARSILLSGGNELSCWSAGCCSGEEAYTLQILWKVRVIPAIRFDLPLRIIATDINRDVLERAREGCYPQSSLRDLPKELIPQAFTQSGKSFAVKKPFRENIEFAEQDIRIQQPAGFFHLILCRNLVLTYFEEALQQEILRRISNRLRRGGIFIIGIHESLPRGVTDIIPYGNTPGIYEKVL
ncbi:MAG: chemotaxis protein CheR [Nitrospirae bacterium]|nr:chemotaxis protein CheR [Nitrospirota bacterium]